MPRSKKKAGTPAAASCLRQLEVELNRGDMAETPEQIGERRAAETASRKLKDAAHLLPEKLDLEPEEGSERAYKNWRRRWNDYLDESGLATAVDVRKRRALFGRVGLKISDCLEGKETYGDTIDALDTLYVKKRNELFLRHQAMKIRQKELDMRKFGLLIREKLRLCKWANRTAKEAEEDLAKIILIEGLTAGSIRQRLLEETDDRSFQQLLDQAEVLEQSQRQALSFELCETM